MATKLSKTPLLARRILLAEDEYLLATELCEELEIAGARVVGPAASVDALIRLIRTPPLPDAAVLDVNLAGQLVFPAADLLQQRGIPIVFTTGYDPWIIPARFGAFRRCEKPIGLTRLVSTLVAAIAAAPAPSPSP